MKKSSTIKKAQMGAAVPSKKGGLSGSMKKFKPTSPIKRPKGPVYEGSTLPEFTVKAPKAKAGKSLGMKSVKAGYDKNPGVTRADIIVAAKKKAKYGAKVAGKKPIKKAQTGDDVSMMEGSTMPEHTVTASRIVDKPSKPAKPQKNYTRDLIKRANKMNRNQAGYSRRNPRRYEEGGQVSKAQDGTSKKKYQYFWQDPESTYSKRKAEAEQNSKMRLLTDQILPQDKVQKFGKFEGYKYYDSPTSESPKLLNDAARLAKKPNVTKAATPSLSKKDIKTYKKTGAAPKAKKGVSVKKTSMGKCKYGC